MSQRLLDWAFTQGYRVTWSSVASLREARAEIERRRDSGEIDRSFYARLPFSDRPDPLPENARSLAVLAVPRPAYTVAFEVDGEHVDAMLPPTYCHYRDLPRRLLPSVAAALGGDVWLLDDSQAPLKTLAVWNGLAEYGRNNIAYVQGMGSYHQLAGFLCDRDLGVPPFPPARRPKSMDECESCTLCRRACPTGAIGEDRFLLHAERCLTLFNEEPDPWPDWLQDDAHNCLVGCMLCEEACPKNKGLLRVESSGVSFTAEETRSILNEPGISGEVWDSHRPET